MKLRPIRRAVIAALVSTGTVVAVDGCISARKLSTPEPDAQADEAPKKEYQWKDMSTGKSFFRPIEPTTSN